MSAVCIAKIVHGSNLFGTSNQESDTDVKSVWLPAARDILLGRIDWTGFDSDSARRNTSSDIDHEQHDLIRFLRAVSAGHPVAVEMVFAPETAFLGDPHPIWQEIVSLAPASIPASISKFLGFIDRQAADFGIGGDRISAVTTALAFLDEAKNRHPKASIADVAQELVEACASSFVKLEMKADGSQFLQIAGRSTPVENKVSVAQRLASSIIIAFEDRARKLAERDKRDWKAVSHAIRLAEEAVELSTLGRISLPRPNAEELIGIKSGKVSTAEVADKIEAILPEIDTAMRASVLNDEPDTDAIEELVISAHQQQVINAVPEMGLNLSRV
jgi:Predicted nucleotidyltransferase.